MVGPATIVLGLVVAMNLAALPERAGEKPPARGSYHAASRHFSRAPVAAHTHQPVSGVSGLLALPDTNRNKTVADTVRGLTPEAAPEPVEAPATRKTTLFTALAIAVLTISTLLLYNVRSR